MLTDEEKLKIKEEEIFRDEVKKSFNSSKPNSVWTFLNSAFGLWILSTIIIGLFTYLFNEYKDNQSKQSEKEAKIKQLDLEIENRISQFWVHIEPLVEQTDSLVPLKKGIAYDTIKVLWDAFKNPPSFNPQVMTSIYKDYDSRTTVSLIIELSALLPEDYYEKDEIDYAAVFIAADGIYFDSEHPTIKEIWNSFDKKIIIDRWNHRFPYTDCFLC